MRQESDPVFFHSLKTHIWCEDKILRSKQMKKKNLNLNKARTVKNDEFYTLYEDIEREIFYYKDEFEGKIIYCNCDDPNRSTFWRFFHLNFERLNLKELVATYYIEGMQTFLYRYSGGNDADISSYDQFSLKEDGDFRSNECQELLNECDIVVSNPPFSLFSDYIQLLLKYEKKFLIIGNKNAATFKDIFPYVKKGEITYGYHNVKEFLQPDGTIKVFGNIGWFTNLPKEKCIRKLSLMHHYYEADGMTQKYDADYPRYENYPAIDVNRVNKIPIDYKGIMGVPMTFLEYYDPEEYELIGYGKENKHNQVGIKPVGESFLNDFFMQGGRGHYTKVMKVLCYYDKEGRAKFPFVRLLIQKK